jgi:hypothetical protein
MSLSACELRRIPLRVLSPCSLIRACSCCLVYRPVANSANSSRTSGARSGSSIRLTPNDLGAFRYPMGARKVQRPISRAAFMPARVRSERTSLSNWAKAARTPSINLPVDVSSIGSVAERSEIPSPLRSARRAK